MNGNGRGTGRRKPRGREEGEKERWDVETIFLCDFQIWGTFYSVLFLSSKYQTLSGQFSRLTHLKNIYKLINLHRLVFHHFLLRAPPFPLCI